MDFIKKLKYKEDDIKTRVRIDLTAVVWNVKVICKHVDDKFASSSS